MIVGDQRIRTPHIESHQGKEESNQMRTLNNHRYIEGKSQPLKTGCLSAGRSIPCQCSGNRQSDQNASQCYRPYVYRDIDEKVFLQLVPTLVSSGRELFSAVLKDDELWQTFRQKAAEAFCKTDQAYFLANIPSFPFCFARLEGTNFCLYQRSKIKPPNMVDAYTFGDLESIAGMVLADKEKGADMP